MNCRDAIERPASEPVDLTASDSLATTPVF